MPTYDGQIRGGHFDLENLTVDYFKKKYLVGLEINGVDTGFYQEYLDDAVEFVAHETGIAICDEVVNDEPHDYDARDWMQYSYLKLNRNPIKFVQKVCAIYPTGNYLWTFPSEWLRVDRNGAQIQIVPSGGSLSQALLGQGGTYLPIIYRNLQYLPQLFHAWYTAGWQDGKVPRELIQAVCKKAAIDVLGVIGDIMYGPGVVSRSLSVDGLSQSTSFVNNGQGVALFQGRVAQYSRDLFGDPSARPDQPGLIQSLKYQYRGLGLTSL